MEQTFTSLREQAKSLGINTFGLSRVALENAVNRVIGNIPDEEEPNSDITTVDNCSNLAIDSEGKVAFFGTKPAWHGLGQIVESAQTSEEAIKLAGLDYTVEKTEMFIGEEGNYRTIIDKYATYRTDTGQPLGIVGNRYTILQNKDAFKFIDDLIGEKKAIFESAGALGIGERIWISCKLPQKLIVGKDDVAENYFFLTNSHDGVKAVEMAFTNVFIVCNNTLNQALRNGKKKQQIRHTSKINSALLTSSDLMGISINNLKNQTEMFESMRKIKITDSQLRKYIEMALKPEIEKISEEEYSRRFTNTVDSILEYTLSDESQLIEERKGNLWGAWNGISGYYNNKYNYDKIDKKFESVMWGSSFQKIQNGLSLSIDILTNPTILS